MENDIWNEISSFLNQLRCENINRESYIYFQELANIQLKKKMEKEKVNKLLDHISYEDREKLKQYGEILEEEAFVSEQGFHQKYYKDLLKSLDLPDIHFHQLRNTYATILLKNSFNSKGVSHLLGHAKEIISVDVYGDTQEIIEDCLDVLEPFIEEVIPKERKDQYYDYSEVIEIDLILEEYFNVA